MAWRGVAETGAGNAKRLLCVSTAVAVGWEQKSGRFRFVRCRLGWVAERAFDKGCGCDTGAVRSGLQETGLRVYVLKRGGLSARCGRRKTV